MTKGPQVDTDSFEGLSSLPGPLHQSSTATESGTPTHAQSSNMDLASVTEGPTIGKRSFASMEEQEVERPVSVEARSVAIDLGMLSLHSDSRQKHYLGSSSGLLFMKLIGAGNAEQVSGPAPSISNLAPPRCVSSSSNLSGEIYHSLYSGLTKVPFCIHLCSSYSWSYTYDSMKRNCLSLRMRICCWPCIFNTST